MQKILFITGPTGSGKTDLSLRIAQENSSEIINADVGQFYKPLTIGTAKPDWKSSPIPHHLFDIIDTPVDFDVCVYRTMLQETVREVWERGNLPIVVGGSLFYIQSLLFPPIGKKGEVGRKVSCNAENLWAKLHKIDPVRAVAIDPNDTYRIQRALELFEKTGALPSSFEPVFQPFCDIDILFLDIDRSILYERINQRTEKMIYEEGWIKEVEDLVGTRWISFLKMKKLIGYSEIITWIEAGKKQGDLPGLIEVIKKKTRHYAKRQLTFWKKFRTLIESFEKKSNYVCRTQTIKNVKDYNHDFHVSKRN